MTLLDTRGLHAQDGPALRPTSPPSVVTAFSRMLTDELCADGQLDAGAVNEAIRKIARDDVSSACLAWRQATNLTRVGQAASLADVGADITSGCLASTVFGSKALAVASADDTLHVTGTSLMTTGVAYATWFITEARQETGNAVLVAVPRDGVIAVERPTFIGLHVADNALIDIDARVSTDRVLGPAEELVGLPYDLGLTMGAVAVGAAEALLETVVVPAPGLVELGELRAQVAAAAALVDATATHAPDAGWWSKAAKVAGTNAALATCAALRPLIGSATYAADHPLNHIEADLRGLVGQAPAHAGAARAAAVPPSRRNPAHDPRK